MSSIGMNQAYGTGSQKSIHSSRISKSLLSESSLSSEKESGNGEEEDKASEMDEIEQVSTYTNHMRG